MKKWAKIIDEAAKTVAVGTGTNTAFYKSIGFVEMDVEEAYDGVWYVAGFAPTKPTATEAEQKAARAQAYQQEVDPITCHIIRLQSEAPSPENTAKIAELTAERDVKVAEIKAEYPYPEPAA